MWSYTKYIGIRISIQKSSAFLTPVALLSAFFWLHTQWLPFWQALQGLEPREDQSRSKSNGELSESFDCGCRKWQTGVQWPARGLASLSLHPFLTFWLKTKTCLILRLYICRINCRLNSQTTFSDPARLSRSRAFQRCSTFTSRPAQPDAYHLTRVGSVLAIFFVIESWQFRLTFEDYFRFIKEAAVGYNLLSLVYLISLSFVCAQFWEPRTSSTLRPLSQFQEWGICWTSTWLLRCSSRLRNMRWAWDGNLARRPHPKRFLGGWWHSGSAADHQKFVRCERIQISVAVLKSHIFFSSNAWLLQVNQVMWLSKLCGGEVAWGPTLLQTSVSGEDLRSMMANALDVSFHRVRLAKGAELIDGQMSLKILGNLAPLELHRSHPKSADVERFGCF